MISIDLNTAECDGYAVDDAARAAEAFRADAPVTARPA